MKGKRIGYGIQAAVGVALMIGALLLLGAGKPAVWSGICIGLGAAFAAIGLGRLLQSLRMTNEAREKIERQKEIEENDERNIRIREKTGSMVAKVMNYVLCAFVLVLLLTGADRSVVLISVLLIAAQLALYLSFSNYYYKRM